MLRPVRALRVLLACLFLWFGASASAPHDAWNEASVVMVADGTAARRGEPRRAAVEDPAENEARANERAPYESTAAVTNRPREAVARRPVRDLYLRNCALLC